MSISRSAKSILIASDSPSSFIRQRNFLLTRNARVPYEVPSSTPGRLSAMLRSVSISLALCADFAPAGLPAIALARVFIGRGSARQSAVVDLQHVVAHYFGAGLGV